MDQWLEIEVKLLPKCTSSLAMDGVMISEPLKNALSAIDFLPISFYC